MPIIKSNTFEEKDKIKIFVNSSILSEIDKYCSWASIKDKSTFFEQATEFILKKDRERKNYKKGNKKSLTIYVQWSIYLN